MQELGGRGDHFSVRWTGQFNFDPAGNYIFTSTSDDGSRIAIDGLVILDRWDSFGGPWPSDPQPLLGWHEVRYDLVNQVGDAAARLTWSFDGGVDMTQICTFGDTTIDPAGGVATGAHAFQSPNPSRQMASDAILPRFADSSGTGHFVSGVPNTFISGCASNCLQFTTFEAATAACSVEETCGGITYENHPGELDLCCDNDGPQAGVCGWCVACSLPH